MAGWFNKILTNLLLRNFTFSKEFALELHELAAKGKLAIVLPIESSLLNLAFRQTSKENQLPALTAITYLRKPKTLMTAKKAALVDPLTALALDKSDGAKPTYFVPFMLVLGRRRASANKSGIDLVFGSRDAPGYIRLLIRIFLTKGQSHWQMGEPVLLEEARHPVSRLRYLLRKQFNRLENTHVGPRAKPYERIRNETLRDSKLNAYIKTTSHETGIPQKDLVKKSRKYFREIAAHFDSDLVRLLDMALGFIFHRIYNGITWQSGQIDMIRKASLKGPVILLPTHKSHMDYLVLSYVLYREGLMCPHIAAGSNLSFFPLGSLFRRGGAYFIRRQFKDDPLYTKVVRAYLYRLLKEGFTQEFFIEGGRTRTGKVLSPKLGLLSIYIDCLCSDRFQEAVFVPASISYERIVESQSFDEEQSGKAKTKESAASLLTSSQVLLKRFGHVFVSFDQPLLLSEVMASRRFDYVSASTNERKRFVKALAHQIVMGMNKSVVVTPASIIALVLLSAKTRAMRESRFLAQALDVLGYLQASHPDIHLSDSLAHDTEASLEAALALLAQDAQIVKKESKNLSYVLAPSQKARSLNFYKNTILHFFVSDALIICAFIAECSASGSLFASVESVRSRVRLLSQIFKFEFVFPVDLSFDEAFFQRLEFLKSRQVFEPIDTNLVVTSSSQAREDVEFLARILQAYFETYFVVFDLALSLNNRGLNEKEFIQSALKHLDTSLKNSLISRPEALNKPSCEFALLSIKGFSNDEANFPTKDQLLKPFTALADVLDALD